MSKKSLGERLAELFQSWILEGDTQEQKETGEYLTQVLAEDRLSYRSFFPPELKEASDS